MLMLGCALLVFGLLTLVFGYPSKAMRSRRPTYVGLLDQAASEQGGRVVFGHRHYFIKSLTARQPWVYFVASPIAAISGLVLIVASG